MSTREWFRFEAKAETPAEADLYIFDEIGKSYWNDDAVTASKLVAAIQALPETVTTIRVHVNSPGGSVFEAHAIANVLRQQRDQGRTVAVSIDGLAASAATIITSAGSTVRIADNAMVMVHEPSAIEWGPASKMRKMADALEGITRSIVAVYRWISAKTEDELLAMMAATTWMNAEEAVANGFAHEIVTGAQVTNRLGPGAIERLGEVPEAYRARVQALLRPSGAEPPASPQPVGPAPASESTDSSQPASPASPAAPTPAAAADVLRLCREAGCLDLAEGLITAQASLADVEARLAAATSERAAEAARASEVRALCALAHLPELADGYVTARTGVSVVRDQLARIKVRLAGGEIDTTLHPDADAHAHPRINVAAIYAARNQQKER